MSNGYDQHTFEQTADGQDWEDAHREQSDAHARSILHAIDEVGFFALNSSLKLLGYQLVENDDYNTKKKTD